METQAIILAAGIGSRLYNITCRIPKCLIQVAQKPILAYQIEAYLKAGLNEQDITIATGYKNDQIEEFLKKNFPKIRTVFNPNYQTTNNMISLYLVLQEVLLKKNFQKITVISNGDCIYESSIVEELLRDHREDLIVCDTSTYQEESMKISLKGDFIQRISKDITQDSSYACSIDLYRFSQKTLQALMDTIQSFSKARDMTQWTEVAIDKILKIRSIEPLDISGKKWIEIDNTEDLINADILFKNFDINTKRACFCDLDGTLFLGEKPITEAIEFIQRNQSKIDFFFLTNNTSKIPEDYVEKLRNAGIAVQKNQILTPLTSLLKYIKENNLHPYFICTQKVKNFIEQTLCQTYAKQEYDGVVLTYDTELTYSKLEQASLLLAKQNSYLLASHLDLCCPTSNGGGGGGSNPDVGSFIALFHSMGFDHKVKTFGKPNISIIQDILENYNRDEIFIVGDRLYTDLALAEKVKIDFVCVLSGETTRENPQLEHAQTKICIIPKLSISSLGVKQ